MGEASMKRHLNDRRVHPRSCRTAGMRRDDFSSSRNAVLTFRRALTLATLTIVLSAATAVAGFLGDITMNRISTKNGVPPVVFPHWKHRIRFRCYVCHPDVFEMQAGTNEITMGDLREGAYCARCHDGKTAWAISFDTCRVCHSLGEM